MLELAREMINEEVEGLGAYLKAEDIKGMSEDDIYCNDLKLISLCRKHRYIENRKVFVIDLKVQQGVKMLAGDYDVYNKVSVFLSNGKTYTCECEWVGWLMTYIGIINVGLSLGYEMSDEVLQRLFYANIVEIELTDTNVEEFEEMAEQVWG